MKKLIYFLVFSVFLGTQIFALNIGFKLSMYRILFLLVFSLCIVMFFNNDQRLRFYSGKLSSSYASFYLFWLFYSLISVAWSQSITGWLKANIFIGIGVFTILFIHLFMKEKKDILNLFKSLAAGVSLHVILGLFEILTGRYIWANDYFMTKYRPQYASVLNRYPISIYANHNDYATVLLMGSFIFIFMIRHTKKITIKSWYFIMLLSSIFLINQTESRANLLALYIGISVMGIVYFSSIIRKKWLISGTIGVIVLSLFGIIASSNLREKILSVIYMIKGNVVYDGSSNMTRMNLIKNGFYFLRETFGFGVGAGNIEHVMQSNPPYQIGTIIHMHNWWMEILTGYGIIIFALYLIVYFSMMRRAYTYYRHSRDSFIRKASLSIIGYLSAFVLSSISSATNIINEWQWIVFGVIIAFFAYCESQHVRKKVYLKNKENISFKKEILGGQHG